MEETTNDAIVQAEACYASNEMSLRYELNLCLEALHSPEGLLL